MFIGCFLGEEAGVGLVALGGYVGILTALVAWYASAALLINGMTGRVILSVSGPIWTDAMGVQHPRPAQAHA